MVHRDRRCLGIAFAMSLCLIGSCLTSFELAQQQVACGCTAFRGWDDGCDNWRISTLADPCLWRWGRHLHSAVLIIALLASHFDYVAYIISVTHALEDKTMTTHASVSSLTVMALCVEGHVQVALAWMSLHLCLPESDRVTLIGLVAICSCCHVRLTGRSQDANWADFAQASSGAIGTAIEDKRTVWVSELRACNTWALRRQLAAVFLK